MPIGEAPKKTKKSTIFRYAYILLTVVVIILIGALDPNFAGLVNSFEDFSPLWLLISFMGIIGYWLTDAWLLKDIASYLYDGKFGFWSALKVGMIGLYYGALTPSATGGQPMQVVYMRRNGIHAGLGTGIVCVKFVTYELAMCIFYVFFMITQGGYYFNHNNKIFWLTMAGFAMNLAIVSFIVVIMINRNFIMRLGTKMINYFSRVKIFKWYIIKDKEKSLASYEKTVTEFTEVILYINKNKRRFIGSMFISLFNMLVYFAMIYFVYRTMGLNEHSFMELLALNTFMYMAVSLVPTPGSSGASEGAFYLLFSGIFPENSMFIGMLLWRFYVYYLILFVGSGIVIGDEVIVMRSKKQAAAMAGKR